MLVRRSEGKSRVNHQPLQYCIQSPEEEIQPEVKAEQIKEQEVQIQES